MKIVVKLIALFALSLLFASVSAVGLAVEEKYVVGGKNRATPTELSPGILYTAKGNICGFMSEPGNRDGVDWYVVDTRGYDSIAFHFPIVTNENRHWLEVFDENGHYIKSTEYANENDEFTTWIDFNNDERLYIQVIFLTGSWSENRDAVFSICLENTSDEEHFEERSTHIWESVRPDRAVVLEATCYQEGIHVDKQCALCGRYGQLRKVPAIPHSAGDWVTEETPTCEASGMQARYCSVCGERISEKAIPATGHTSGEWQVFTEPTCTTTGYRARTCQICGKVLQEEGLPARGHDFTEWEVIADATYRFPGTRVRDCLVCGEQEFQEYSLDLPENLLEVGDYELEILPDNTARLIGFYGDANILTLPSEFEGHSLTSIAQKAFILKYDLVEVTIPETVNQIDDATFDDFPDLELVVDRNSYGRQFAIDHGIRYTYPDANDWLTQ